MKKLCAVDELAEGSAKAFDTPGGGIVLLLTVEGPRAWRNVCPHQGRSLDFAPGEFLFTPTGLLVCPHHGACFEPGSGACTDGPCQGSALTAVPVTVKDGHVWLAPQDGADRR